MKSSEQINEIAAALAKAQGLLKPASKDSENPHYRSRYADLASCWAAWHAVGPDCGLGVVQDVTTDDRGVSVTTRVLHTSGQWYECGPLIVPLSKPDAHGVGSATTYAKRFSLGAALGIVAEDDVDDDGNAAVASKPLPKSRRAAVDKEDTAARPGVVAEAQAETDAARLFDAPPPPDVETQRNLLLGQIKGCADKLKLGAKERATLWDDHVGGDPRKADPSALQDLLSVLRARMPV